MRPKVVVFGLYLLFAAVLSLNATGQNALQMQTIPITLTSPSERANYLVENYWGKCRLDASELLTAQSGDFEQFFVDYIFVMSHAERSAQLAGIRNLLNNCPKPLYLRVVELAEKYLYEPNSPMLNEQRYIQFLQVALDGTVLTSAEKIRPREQLNQAMKNHIGSTATNFSFTLFQGGASDLRASLGANQTLLIFYDSECENCERILGDLKADVGLSRAVRLGRVKVLAVCLEGSKSAWRSHRASIPDNWTVGYAQENFDDLELYVIRAFPTLYLLDSNGRVLLKDPQPAQLLNFLR